MASTVQTSMCLGDFASWGQIPEQEVHPAFFGAVSDMNLDSLGKACLNICCSNPCTMWIDIMCLSAQFICSECPVFGSSTLPSTLLSMSPLLSPSALFPYQGCQKKSHSFICPRDEMCKIWVLWSDFGNKKNSESQKRSRGQTVSVACCRWGLRHVHTFTHGRHPCYVCVLALIKFSLAARRLGSHISRVHITQGVEHVETVIVHLQSPERPLLCSPLSPRGREVLCSAAKCISPLQTNADRLT